MRSAPKLDININFTLVNSLVHLNHNDFNTSKCNNFILLIKVWIHNHGQELNRMGCQNIVAIMILISIGQILAMPELFENPAGSYLWTILAEDLFLYFFLFELRRKVAGLREEEIFSCQKMEHI